MVKSIKYDILDDETNAKLKEEHGDSFESMIGAEAIQNFFQKLIYKKKKRL